MTKLNDNNVENVVGGTILPYKIEEGDTIGELAKKFHCTVEDICRWNNIEDPSKVFVGQKLEFKF